MQIVHLFLGKNSGVQYLKSFSYSCQMYRYKKGVQPFLCLPNPRLPPSDLHVQQARNSPRLISVNLPTACSRTLNDWRYSGLENKS